MNVAVKSVIFVSDLSQWSFLSFLTQSNEYHLHFCISFLHLTVVSYKLYETWRERWKLHRLELRICSKIDVGQAWRVKFSLDHRAKELTFHLLRLFNIGFYSWILDSIRNSRRFSFASAQVSLVCCPHWTINKCYSSVVVIGMWRFSFSTCLNESIFYHLMSWFCPP